MKILSCSDIHLDTFQQFSHQVDNPVSNSRLENSLKALDIFFETGAKDGVLAYVINGDLFNQRLKINPAMYSYCIRRVVDAFRSTPDGSILFVNVGNHDEQTRYLNPNSVSILREFSEDKHKIVVADKRNADIYKLDNDSNLILIPFTEDIENSKKEIKTALNLVDRPTTVFAHLGVAGSSSGRWSHKLDGAYNLSDLGWDNKNVVGIHLGHYHLGQTLKEEGSKKAFYEGNLIPINFNDVEESGVGLKKGFWESNSVTGEALFNPVTGVLPTFNIFDYGAVKSSPKKVSELSDFCKDNYARIVVHSDKELKEARELLKEVSDNVDIQLKNEVKEVAEINIDENSSDSEIMEEYFKKFYKGKAKLLKKALGILKEVE